MFEFDPIALDRSLRAAAEETHEWRQRLREQASLQDDPFERFRADLGRSRFLEVSQLPQDDPLRRPLMRWIWDLMEQRINRVGLTQLAFRRYQQQLGGTYPSGGRVTVAEMLDNALQAPQRRRAWLAAFFDEAQPLSALERDLWERRQEIATQLELASPDELELPASAEHCTTFAVECHAALEEPLQQWRREAPHEWLEVPLGQSQASALPAHLRESTLADWFREARLLEGLRLRHFEFPRHWGLSSFLRALDALGEEFRWATAPTNQPFVIAHDPFGLEQYVMGACFASLLHNPSFLERRLGVDRKKQRDLRRAVAATTLIELAARACKLRLREAALTAPGSLQGAHRELVAEWLGPAAPHAASLAWFRLRRDDAQRLCGAVLGYALSVRLCEEHDEDWFRSPRAVERLRSEAAMPPTIDVQSEQFEEALSVTRAHLCASL